MQESILQIINEWGYAGIVLLIAVENVFPPIPSEVILTFGGFMTTVSELNIAGVVVASTLGSAIGAAILYMAGRCLNRERLIRWVNGKAGRVLCLKQADVEKADGWFRRKGRWAVFFGRFIPVVRSLISLPAGMNRMPFGPFMLLTLAGTCIWNTVLTVLGSALGHSWPMIAQAVSQYSAIVVILLALLLLAAVLYFFRRRRGQEKNR